MNTSNIDNDKLTGAILRNSSFYFQFIENQFIVKLILRFKIIVIKELTTPLIYLHFRFRLDGYKHLMVYYTYNVHNCSVPVIVYLKMEPFSF